jgi:DNA helicase-2/ATP-dependent DNA helicase PcrA
MDFIAKLKKHKNIDLNEQQIEAVNTIDGAILLLAVPGSGKTTVVISRIGNMLYTHKILPEDILTLTFSKAAANDMAERYRKIFGDKYAPSLNFRTIHSFCLEVINNYVSDYNKVKKDILDNPAQIIRSIGKTVTGQFMDDEHLKNIITEISFHKNMLHPDNQFKNDDMPEFAEIYRRYEAYKKEHRLMDYDDMLYNAYFVLTQNKQVLAKYQSRFKYINVDEAQDTSYIQHKIIQLLAVKHNNIFMVGDEDQSIYAFRAAYPKALLDFENNYKEATILKIERNYRSTKLIVTAANTFIKYNKERKEKNMYCENNEGMYIRFTRLKDLRDQYKYLKKIIQEIPEESSLAILYRNNNSAVPIIDMLHREQIPHYSRENDFFFMNHLLVKDFIYLIKFALNPSDIESLEKVYYKIDAGISKQHIELMKKVMSKKQNAFDFLTKNGQLYKTALKKITACKYNLANIDKYNATDAVTRIEKQLNLEWYESKGFLSEDLNQKIIALKCIASGQKDIHEFISRLAELEKLIKSPVKGSRDITLSTIHSSKGLEYDKVVIIDAVEGQFPSQEAISALDDENNRTLMEEETRLFYVGITRAKHELEIISTDKINDNPSSESRFIKILSGNYKEPVKVNYESNYQPNTPVHNQNVHRKQKNSGILYYQNMIFKPGTHITHRSFGNGIVVSCNSEKETIEIIFINGKGSGLTKTFSVPMCVSNGFITINKD